MRDHINYRFSLYRSALYCEKQIKNLWYTGLELCKVQNQPLPDAESKKERRYQENIMWYQRLQQAEAKDYLCFMLIPMGHNDIWYGDMAWQNC